MARYKYFFTNDDQKLVEELTRDGAVELFGDWKVEALEELARRDGFFQKSNIVVVCVV